MPPKQLSSPTSLDLEDKYHVEVAGTTVLLPYTLAKKQATYPDYCIFEHDEPMPAIDRTHLCWMCTEWMRESLATVAKHWSDLEDALAPAGGRAVSSERVTGTGDLYPPLPIDGTVSDVMREARRAIWSAVGQLGDDHGWVNVRLPADHGTGVLADWLARWHVGYLAGHPSATHLTAVGTDLAIIVPKIKDAVYQAPAVELHMNVSCTQQLADKSRCPGQVVAVQTPDGRKVVRCSEDITHRVAADQWFYTHANSRPGRARNALKKKYMKARH
ncbi:hypothetical protein [Arthrobacter sp. HS15c]|uniref:hypothetical protein n=1 Tax=Arthrobacter sp. HS15c TaxID=3230279 RepID=UPI003466D4FF